jgi:hypothetical protein
MMETTQFSSPLQPRRQRRKRVSSPLSISDKFHFATALCKGGVLLLEEGKVARALGLFQESLVLSGEAVRQLHADASSETASDHGPACSANTVQKKSMTRDMMDQTATEQEEKRPDRRTSLDISNSPIFSPTRLHYIEKVASKYVMNGFVDWRALKLNSAESLPPHVRSFFLLSFAVTYNVALCHQFLGMCFAPRTPLVTRKQSLLKAIRSYEIVHNMMAQEEELQSDVSMLLVLMNNLSRVQIALGERKQASFCCQRIVSILMYITDHEDLDMPSDLFEKYFSNISPLILRRSQSAAAA